MLTLAALLSTLVGVALGLLGGGGSVLLVPLLVYVLGVEPKQAIASSLFVVGVTSLAALGAHARAGRVVWRAGALMGGAGMAGAYVGGWAAHWVPARALLVAFAALMLVASAGMIRGHRGATSASARPVSPGKALALGAGVGALAGLVGAGGGFLVVPALVLLGGLAMPNATATSLLVIGLQSLAGFAGQIAHTPLDWPLLLVLTSSAAAGSLVGARLASRANPAALRMGFGWMVLAVGVFLLGEQLLSAT